MNIAHAHFMAVAEFLSQGGAKVETSDSRQFLDSNWPSKNYLE